MAETAAPYPDVVPGPPKPSRIRETGLLALPPGTERVRVEGGGIAGIALGPGDHVTIVDVEGGQTGLLAFATEGGAFDLGPLGLAGNATGEGMAKRLSNGEGLSFTVRRTLAPLLPKLAPAPAHAFHGPDAVPGCELAFGTTARGMLLVEAPGGRMDFERQDTATPLLVWVRRAVVDPHQRFSLPDPLADPLFDLRVRSATAEAYTVKAGDYIQILDVDGRQCTDFQCFARRKIDNRMALPLDATTTRSIQGRDYPVPGLHGKYFDQEMTPLVEVVQDTCGRHDSFSLACTAKFYDDIGYPGHVNCSANFNSALDPYGVDPRPGWMAINFFFNTGIDPHGLMIADEPWSRPGDYVLLRALTDLVCVSSACPDDTTAANGWYLSDIHVRTYDGAERFQRAVAFRPTPDAEPRMTKETGFHKRFAEHTRYFVEYNGYWLADRYAGSDPIEEYWACRTKAALTDLSALRKFEVTGPDAEALLNYTLTRNVKKLSPGQVVYTAMCYPHGGMIDDGTLFRLDKDNFRWIGGTDYGGDWMREQAQKLDLKVLVRSSSDQMHNLAVQGPESRAILKKIIWTAPHRPSLEEVGWFRFTIGRIGDDQGVPVVVSRTGYTGELGFEVFCHPKDAETVFDAIWEAGRPHGLQPLGLAALDLVRIEAGLIFAGYEFSDETDPFEAGIGFTVPLKSKDTDFIGRDALIRRKENAQKKLVGLEIDSELPVGHGDCVHQGRAQIGVITSGMRSPLLKKNIALARVDVSCSEIGTELEIGKLDGHQKRLPARVVRFPHYDPDKTKPRS